MAILIFLIIAIGTFAYHQAVMKKTDGRGGFVYFVIWIVGVVVILWIAAETGLFN